MQVTHIFLADQCWDLSVEQQVISRAFRMGATESVHVEQLLMSGTVEEQLHNMVHGLDAPSAAAPPSTASGSAAAPHSSAAPLSTAAGDAATLNREREPPGGDTSVTPVLALVPPQVAGSAEASLNVTPPRCAADAATERTAPSRNALGKRPMPPPTSSPEPPHKRALPVDCSCQPSSPTTPSRIHASSPSTPSTPHATALTAASASTWTADSDSAVPAERKRGDEAKIHRLLRTMHFVRDEEEAAALPARPQKSARKSVSFL